MKYLLVVLMLSLMAAGQAQDAASLASKVDKNDPALTNARTPLAHNHTKAQITDFPAIPTVPTVPTCSGTDKVTANGTAFSCAADQTGSSSGGLDAGLIVLSDSSCPSGYTELAALAGLTIKVTSTTNGDAGQTGGSNSITPQGTVASTFSGSQVTTSAVSAGTPAGTIANHSTQTTKSASSGTSQTTVSTATHAFTGTALGTHSHTETAAGSVSSTFTGQTVNLDLAHVNLLLCKKN